MYMLTTIRGVHHIQTKILGKLLYADSFGYAAMRPAGIESNQFAYHLDQLLRAGLICKQDRKYMLTPAGLTFVDRLSQTAMVPRMQPNILTAIQLTNDHNQILLYTRKFQPYIYRHGLPQGKIHMGETVAQAASRELQEKTGLSDIKLTQKGIVYLEVKQQGALINKILVHLFTGSTNRQPKDVDPARGVCMWANPADYQVNELMPGFMAIQQLLADLKDFFFAELFVDE
jgi:ADP-ribose pyrophosphatase YjhB (NUDIX family)